MPLKLRSKRGLENQLVARLDRPAEARLVDADEIEAGVLVRHSSADRNASSPATCASASMIMTPGISGRCGKWPMKYGSL